MLGNATSYVSTCLRKFSDVSLQSVYSDERERRIRSFSGLRKRNDACCLRKFFGMVETNKLLRRRVVFLSSDNETRRLNEPVIFRFRDFKFAQRRGASRHLRCGTSSRTITYTRSTFPKLRRLRRDEVMGDRRHWHTKEMSHLTHEI